MKNRIVWIFRVPLFRLLAINLAIGIAAAVLMITGLLLLNPYGLRTLLLSDRSGVMVFVLLLFGFVVTFGSTAMGTAIMALGRDTGRGGGSKAKASAAAATPRAATLKVPARFG
jgi:hypothetical protein